MIFIPYYNPYEQHLNQKFTNKYPANENILLYTKTAASPMSNLKTEDGFIDIFCADLDGKGEDEVIKVNNTVSGNYDKLQFKVYTGNGSGYSLKYTWDFNFSTLLTVGGVKSIHPKFYYTGDFNGDGKSEVLVVSSFTPLNLYDANSKYYLFDLISGTKLYEGSGLIFRKDFLNDNNSDRIYILDYDGDGRSEICHINTYGTHIYKLSMSASSYWELQTVGIYTGLTREILINRTLLAGELNGDGKSDFLLSPPTTNSSDYDWNIYYSKGGTSEVFEKTTCRSANNASGINFFMQDVNGDGLTDMIKVQSDKFLTYIAGNNIIPYLSDGNTYTSMTAGANVFSGNASNCLYALKDGKIKRYAYPRNDTQEKLLTGVANSFGIVEKRSYETLSRLSSYTMGSGASFPYINFHGTLYVPVETELYIGGTKREHVSYTFSNAVVHKQGLGFRGFGKITQKDEIRDRQSWQEYDPCNFGVLRKEESPFVTNAYEYSFDIATNKIAKVRLTSASLKDNLKNVTITKSYPTYDTYGNPKVESISYGDGISESISRDFYNNTSESNYILGFLTNMTKTTTRNGISWPERFQVVSHNNKGLALTTREYVNNRQIRENTYAYDANGNDTLRTEKNYSSAALSYRYEYDTSGRLKKEKDPMGFTTNYDYNTKGELSSVKNHKNQATTYEYDGFGRIAYIYAPGNITKRNSYSWSYDRLSSVYHNYTHTYGYPWEKTYYDALNREVASGVLQVDGGESLVSREYDTYARLWKVSLPFTGSSAPYWAVYGYDGNDRLTSVVEASGRKTLYRYSGKNVTTTRDGIESTRYYDTQGNLTSVSDPGGSIIYNLRPDGQPSSIVVQDSVITDFGYDDYGRRLSITDPSAGTQSWKYYATGNIEYEKDANNKTVNYKYDTYNRITEKKCPEFTASYDYNPDGLLGSIISTNGTSTVYDYDAYGRLESEKETVPDGKFFRKKYAFNGNGIISSAKYFTQDGEINTENYYYLNGTLNEIKMGGTVSIWKLNTENAAGQPTSVTTGPFTRTYGYSPTSGLPTSRSAGSFQSFSYNFDAAKGNLSNRKDVKTNIQEDFLYDNLNRLTNFGGKSAGYNINGNLEAKSDVGSFTYKASGKPYAISGVTTSSSAVPQREQTLTYTSFKRPATITENNYTAAFTYNDAYRRVKMEVKKNGVKEMNRYYIGDCYEIDDKAVGGIRQKIYLGGDYYTAPAAYVKDGTSNWQIYYICRDYMGSITHATNSSGTVVQTLSYDAWGSLRNPTTQVNYAPGSEPVLLSGRGYTGHEHLPWFGLVNMNARLYDPAVGRFLSPDPYIQAPDMTQNFNRYSYCLNNPLRYTDPEGEIIFSILSAIFCPALLPVAIGADMGWMSGGMKGVMSSDMNFWDGAWRGGVSGAVGGALSYVGGAGMSLGMNMALGAGEGLLTGALNAALWDTNIGKGASWGAASGLTMGFLSSEQFRNWTKGGGFASNQQVYKNIMHKAFDNPDLNWRQEVLDYFGFEGTYDPNLLDPGRFNGTDKSITYGPSAFGEKYDHLLAVYKEEKFHSVDYLIYKSKVTDQITDPNAFEEWRAQVHLYRNQGLYPNSGVDWGQRANMWGSKAGVNPDLIFKYNFDRPWWHFIYKISRRW